jgi:hypothetical protein
VAGVMYRCGFDPKTPQEIEEERKIMLENAKLEQKQKEEEERHQKFLHKIRIDNLARIKSKFKELSEEEQNEIRMEFDHALHAHNSIKDFDQFLLLMVESGGIELGVRLLDMDSDRP